MKINMKHNLGVGEKCFSRENHLAQKSFNFNVLEEINLAKSAIYEKAFFLCEKAEKKLADSEKYLVFLGQLHRFSKANIDLTEFLNIVDDDKIRADERFMNELEDFLERCETAEKEWSRSRFDSNSKRVKVVDRKRKRVRFEN